MTTAATTYTLPCALHDAELRQLLDDDAPLGDLTTHSLGLGAQAARLRCAARGPMTVCGSEEAQRLFALVGAQVRVLVPSGTPVASGTLLLEAEGSAAQLHLAWKTAQTLLEWASGLASGAAELVAAAHAGARAVRVACTRKTVPGTKALSARAVRAGSVRARNAADDVRAGADLLVSSAPYAAAPRDVQVSIEELA